MITYLRELSNEVLAQMVRDLYHTTEYRIPPEEAQYMLYWQTYRVCHNKFKVEVGDFKLALLLTVANKFQAMFSEKN